MSSKLPLVSVVIPAYNAENFIERTLKSVLSQTYKNLEVIVVDDGSEDCTAEIVRSFAKQDSRVNLVLQTNAGVVAARNFAIQIAKGELVAPLDSDDIWFPENIEKQVQCLLQSNTSVGLTYGWSIDIDEHGMPTGEFHAYAIEGKVLTTLLCHDFVGNASSVLIRRVCFERIGGYRCQEGVPQGCEDWELYLRIAEQYQFRVVPEFLISYRKHTSSMSCDYSAMAKFRNAVWQSMRQKYPKMPIAIYRLASGSFYMYLARQSNLSGQPQSTLFWLYQTVRIDCITPFLRLGLYKLLIKSLFELTFQPLAVFQQTNYYSKDISKVRSALKRQPTTVLELSELRQAARFKVFIGNLLHRFIPIIFGTPETWKEAVRSDHEQSSTIN